MTYRPVPAAGEVSATFGAGLLLFSDCPAMTLEHCNQCPVCFQDYFIETSVFLPCRHWVCSTCLARMQSFAKQRSSHRLVQKHLAPVQNCPCCRTPFDFSKTLDVHLETIAVVTSLPQTEHFDINCPQVQRLGILATNSAYANIAIARTFNKYIKHHGDKYDSQVVFALGQCAQRALDQGCLEGLFYVGGYYEHTRNYLNAAKAYILAIKQKYESNPLKVQLLMCCEQLLREGCRDDAITGTVRSLATRHPKVCSPWAMATVATHLSENTSFTTVPMVDDNCLALFTNALRRWDELYAQDPLRARKLALVWGGQHSLAMARACAALADAATDNEQRQHYINRITHEFASEHTHSLILQLNPSYKRPFYF